MQTFLTDEYVKCVLPKRFPDSNKGTYGKAAIFAGSFRYLGAAVLSARGALCGGAGYTALFLPKGLILPLAGQMPEVLLRSASRGKRWKYSKNRLKGALDYTAIAAGMGMENTAQTAKIVLFLLSEYTGKLILDADALNALAKYCGVLGAAEAMKNKSCTLAITPHPAEFSRLTGIPLDEILKDGGAAAQKYAAENGVTVLLKGAAGKNSVVTDGARVLWNATGNSGMAKGGSGDVLSGFIASLAASGADVFDAACEGAYLAGRAADVAVKRVGEYALTASIEAECFGEAFSSLK